MRILKLLITTCLLPVTIHMFSQVGINTEEPYKLTELHIKNLVQGTDTIPKGIMIPRMTEAQRNAIVIDDADDANSLLIYNITQDCFNYYSRKEAAWQSICGGMGNAVFDPVSCANIVPKGTYAENLVANNSNYLSITVNVTSPGLYTIAGTTTNGYNFFQSNAIYSTGPTTLNIPCQGAPTSVGTDTVTIIGLPVQQGCTTTVTVQSSIAAYSLNCSHITVNGSYRKNMPLTSSNTISIGLNVSTLGYYNISTPVKNGVSFSASGVFTTTGMQIVTLLGLGTPTVNVDFPIDIKANTIDGNDECTAVIPVILPEMTYAVIGTGNYSWVGSARNTALTGETNFGPAGVVKMAAKLNLLWSTNSQTTAAANLNSTTMPKPDVLFFTNYGNDNANSNLQPAIADYIDKGGCLIYFVTDANPTQVNLLLNPIFSVNDIAQAQVAGSRTVDDNDYPIASLPNDPIINGPFGNLSARYWGEDNASTGSIIVTTLPSNSVQICSAYNPFGKTDVNPAYSIVWYNDYKNFVYFGDSTGASIDNTGQNDWPTVYSSTGAPLSKLYGNYPQPTGSPSQYVYNSALELNSLAWALKKAAVSGINPH